MNTENYNCAGRHPYEPLLCKIATCFGLGVEETGRLLKEVYASAGLQDGRPDNRGSLKIQLAKRMVRKCIFTVSAELFSKRGFYGSLSRQTAFACSLGRHETHPVHFQDMPLSFRAVYILRTHAGLEENETAEVLNATSIQVRERLAKARLFIDTYLR